MAYEKVNWQNGSSGGTPLDADNLNHMDVAIASAISKADEAIIAGTGAMASINAAMPKLNRLDSSVASASASATAAATSETNASASAASASASATSASSDATSANSSKVSAQTSEANAKAYRDQAEAIVGASDSRMTKAEKSLSALWNLNKGQTYDIVEDTKTSHADDVISGAKYVTLDVLGGKTRKSKNLLVPTLTSETTTNGVTCTPLGDGTYKLNGTATAKADFTLITFEKNEIIDGTYKLVGCPNGGASSVYKLAIENTTTWSGGNDYGSGSTISISNSQYVYLIYIRIYSGQTVSNLIFKPMLTTDTSLTYADYEKGFYGLLNNPIAEVQSVGANLVDTESKENSPQYIGHYYTQPSSGSYALVTNASQNAFRIPVIGGNTYTSSYSDGYKMGMSGVIRFEDGNNSAIGGTEDGYSNNKVTFTVPNNCEYIVFSLSTTNAKNIMLVNGSSVLPYKPYMSDKLSVIPTEFRQKLIDMGYGMGINDTCYNYVDFVPKKYSNMKSVDLGTLNWKASSSTTGAYYATLSDYYFSSDVVAMCDKYGYIGTITGTSRLGGNYDKIVSLFYSANSSEREVSIKDTLYSSASDLKSALNGTILHYEASEGGEDYEAMLYHKKVGEVDLGSYTWTYSTINDLPCFVSSEKIADRKYQSGSVDLRSAIYTPVAYRGNINGDKQIAPYNATNSNSIWITNYNYTDASTFKSAMNGQKLIYETATEHIYDVTDILSDETTIPCESGGTITYIGQDESNETPVPHKVEYIRKLSEVTV